jgi:hypothetical protein
VEVINKNENSIGILQKYLSKDVEEGVVLINPYARKVNQ